MSESRYLAIDLGASSGRGVVGVLSGGRLAIREVHRFANSPIEKRDALYTDSKRIFENVIKCISYGRGAGIRSVGIDAWGVDYALISETGKVLERPRHYRDPRTKGLMDEAAKVVGRERIFERTGIAFLPFNTLYQLMAERKAGGLEKARGLVFIPDLMNYWLTGIWKTETTIASTSQMYDPVAKTWARELLKGLDIPEEILPEIGQPGTVLGQLSVDVLKQTGAGGACSVILPASHDTGSAAVAVPATSDGDWAYISSGTWSLLGRELKAPLCTPAALKANFTNECGLADTIRFQKNVTGLWILQRCERTWKSAGKAYTHSQLVDLAKAAEPLRSFVDPDHAVFAEFGDMPQRVREFCERTRQVVPQTDGAVVRCVLESLALKCRVVLDQLEELTGPVATMHMVGGGIQNALLCQFTANAMQRPLFAGPVEATAIGNIMAQALAMKDVSSMAEIRKVVGASFAPVRYLPRDSEQWREALTRFRKILV